MQLSSAEPAVFGADSSDCYHSRPWNMIMLHCLKFCPSWGHSSLPITLADLPQSRWLGILLFSLSCPQGCILVAFMTELHAKSAVTTNPAVVSEEISVGTKPSHILPFYSPIVKRLVVNITSPVESNLSIFREIKWVIQWLQLKTQVLAFLLQADSINAIMVVAKWE